MSKKTDNPKLITFGKGGDTVHYSNSTLTGYGSPEHPHAADNKRGDIPDGCPVINKIPAIDNGGGFELSIHGPMVNVDLPDNKTDKAPEPCHWFESAVSGNQFGVLLKLQKVSKIKKEKYGPLDSVSIPVFIELWKNAGAIIGHFHNGFIIWD